MRIALDDDADGLSLRTNSTHVSGSSLSFLTDLDRVVARARSGLKWSFGLGEICATCTTNSGRTVVGATTENLVLL